MVIVTAPIAGKAAIKKPKATPTIPEIRVSFHGNIIFFKCIDSTICITPTKIVHKAKTIGREAAVRPKLLINMMPMKISRRPRAKCPK